MAKTLNPSEYRVTIKQKQYEVTATDRQRTVYEVSRDGLPFTLRKIDGFYELTGAGELICRSMTVQFKRSKAQV